VRQQLVARFQLQQLFLQKSKLPGQSSGGQTYETILWREKCIFELNLYRDEFRIRPFQKCLCGNDDTLRLIHILKVKKKLYQEYAPRAADDNIDSSIFVICALHKVIEFIVCPCYCDVLKLYPPAYSKCSLPLGNLATSVLESTPRLRLCGLSWTKRHALTIVFFMTYLSKQMCFLCGVQGIFSVTKRRRAIRKYRKRVIESCIENTRTVNGKLSA
jgi:hypothetical protein